MQHMLIKGLFLFRKAYLVFLILFTAINNYGQTPTHIPREKQTPVDFFESTEQIVLYIFLPLAIVLLYILWRKRLKKQRKEQEETKE